MPPRSQESLIRSSNLPPKWSFYFRPYLFNYIIYLYYYMLIKWWTFEIHESGGSWTDRPERLSCGSITWPLRGMEHLGRPLTWQWLSSLWRLCLSSGSFWRWRFSFGESCHLEASESSQLECGLTPWGSWTRLIPVWGSCWKGSSLYEISFSLFIPTWMLLRHFLPRAGSALGQEVTSCPTTGWSPLPPILECLRTVALLTISSFWGFRRTVWSVDSRCTGWSQPPFGFRKPWRWSRWALGTRRSSW